MSMRNKFNDRRSNNTIIVSYKTDVGSMNRKVVVDFSDLNSSDRRQLMKGLKEHDELMSDGPRAVFSSLVVQIGDQSFGSDPHRTPALFDFARRMLGGRGTFGNDPGW